MKILVTGASGFIGSALLEHLSNIPGFTIVGMLRSMGTNISNSSVEFRQGDLDAEKKINIYLNDIDVIIHTAGRAHIMIDDTENSVDEFRRVNTLGTLQLAQLAADAGVKRFVFLSSIKVNGEYTDLGSPFSILDNEKPIDPYGISKHEAEIGLRKISQETDMQTTIIRLPLVYGPGVKGNFSDLIKLISLRIPLPLAMIKYNRRSMIGLDNLLSFTVKCISHPKAANETFLISDNHDLSTSSLLTLLGSSIGKPVILFKLPIPILKLFARIFNLQSRADRLLGNLEVDISHTCNLMDWEPPLSVEQGFKKLKIE